MFFEMLLHIWDVVFGLQHKTIDFLQQFHNIFDIYGQQADIWHLR